MTRGYDRPLYIQPFDHRGSFQKKMFGLKAPLSDAQTAEIAGAKQIIYDGFNAALSGGVPEEKAGILVDEQFGAAILRDASGQGHRHRLPGREKRTGRIRLRVRRRFRAPHRGLRSRPSARCWCATTRRATGRSTSSQAGRLKRLSDYLHGAKRSHFMFELLVPAEKAQLDALKGDKKAYDLRSGRA